MTVYTGTGARTTALINGTSGIPTKITVGLYGARMRIITDTYELLAAEATSTLWLARLPSNARISNLSRLSWDDLSSDVSTLDVGVFNPTGLAGFTDDADAINDGLDLGTATVSARLLKDFANAAKYLWQFTDATSDPKQHIDIIATVLDASTTDTGTITWSLVYMLD